MGSGPRAGTTDASGLPGSRATGLLRTPAKRRALVLEPWPSARRAAVQWTTDAPAWRAEPHSRATASTIGPAAAASSGRAERSPTTPDWISEVTTAQRSGRTSSARSTAIAADPI